MKKEDRFCIVPRFKFHQEDSSGSRAVRFEAYYIVNSPKKNLRFVILEHHHSVLNYCYFICSYFSSEESMLRAFLPGLKEYVDATLAPPKEKPTPTIQDIMAEVSAWGTRTPRFEKYPGHIFSEVFEDFETPWFLAKKGQRIRGDKVIEPPPRKRLPKKRNLGKCLLR